MHYPLPCIIKWGGDLRTRQYPPVYFRDVFPLVEDIFFIQCQSAFSPSQDLPPSTLLNFTIILTYIQIYTPITYLTLLPPLI